MTVWYLGIQPQQEPFDIGLDEPKRQQYSFNVLVTKRPSATLPQELVEILVAAGVGQAGVNIFAAAAAIVPVGDGPFLSIRPTGGTAPIGTHNHGVAAYRRPSAQIIVTGKRAAAALAMAHAAYDALAAVRNMAVGA